MRLNATILISLALAAGLGAQQPRPPEREIRVARQGHKRALVIGNAAYPKWPLRNPANDAADMGVALRELGFEAEVLTNVGLKALEQAVDRFVAKLGPSDTALFFYAGHGVQLGGENYLIPVDFDAKDEADAKYVAYSASRIHDRMDASGASLNILVLDACRNNPFGSGRSMGGGGLAAMNTGRGSFIAFATAPGKTASDNPSGRNGLFTASLLTTIRQDGLSLDQVFNRVRQQVYQNSSQQQLPWTSSSVIGDFFFRGSGPSTAGNTVLPSAPPEPERPKVENPLARVSSAPPGSNPPPFFGGTTPTNSAPTNLVVDPGTLAADAAAAFQQGNAAVFEARARELFQTPGGRLALSLAHYHTIAGIHPSTLVIEAGRISFDPVGNTCSQKAVSAAISDVTTASFGMNMYQEPLLNLKWRDPANPKKTLNFNFGTPDSWMTQAGSIPVMRSPAHAPMLMQALGRVIRDLSTKR